MHDAGKSKLAGITSTCTTLGIIGTKVLAYHQYTSTFSNLHTKCKSTNAEPAAAPAIA
jgi:hypothetical protein